MLTYLPKQYIKKKETTALLTPENGQHLCTMTRKWNPFEKDEKDDVLGSSLPTWWNLASVRSLILASVSDDTAAREWGLTTFTPEKDPLC